MSGKVFQGLDYQGRHKASQQSDSAEIWKEIPGYEGHYSVSSWGRIYSHRRVKDGPKGMQSYGGRPVSQRKARKGYMTAILCKDDVKKTHFVHSLVLSAFAGLRPDGMHCCHNDGCRTNNHLENLRWDTPGNNEADKLKHGTLLRGEKHPMARLSEEDALNIKHSNEKPTVLASLYGIARQTVSDIKLGRIWGHLLSQKEVNHEQSH